MSILYKYFDQSFLENLEQFENFILNPTLKLSLPNKLNDPFESFVARDIKRHLDIYNSITSAVFPKNISESIMDSEFERNIELSGIVSLTETSRNKLMWAHYASEHKGVVIGFNTTHIEKELSDKQGRCSKKRFITPKPIKINYNSVRFDLINEHHEGDVGKEMLQLMLTTKSDDWIYEKEHRFIIPLELSDLLATSKASQYLQNIANKKTPEDNYFLHYEFAIESDSSLKNRFIVKHFPTKGEFLINDTLEYLIKNGVSFFKRIPPESIHSIHLGVRTSSALKGKVIKMLTSNKLNNRIKLYDYSLNENYFELDANFINLSICD